MAPCKDDKFGKFIEKLFMALLISCVAFGVKFLGDMSTSLQSLNERVIILTTNVETALQRVAKHAGILERHETRIDELESQKVKPPMTRASGG
jgi:hypothetical protein